MYERDIRNLAVRDSDAFTINSYFFLDKRYGLTFELVFTKYY
jgi:hypothetical protein